MKFKCISSGCVYNFESDLDIKSMLKSPDYVQVADEPTKPAAEAPVVPTTVVPVRPAAPAPGKPLPVTPVAPKAV